MSMEEQDPQLSQSNMATSNVRTQLPAEIWTIIAEKLCHMDEPVWRPWLNYRPVCHVLKEIEAHYANHVVPNIAISVHLIADMRPVMWRYWVPGYNTYIEHHFEGYRDPQLAIFAASYDQRSRLTQQSLDSYVKHINKYRFAMGHHRLVYTKFQNGLTDFLPLDLKFERTNETVLTWTFSWKPYLSSIFAELRYVDSLSRLETGPLRPLVREMHTFLHENPGVQPYRDDEDGWQLTPEGRARAGTTDIDSNGRLRCVRRWRRERLAKYFGYFEGSTSPCQGTADNGQAIEKQLRDAEAEMRKLQIILEQSLPVSKRLHGFRRFEYTGLTYSAFLEHASSPEQKFIRGGEPHVEMALSRLHFQNRLEGFEYSNRCTGALEW